MSSTTCLIVNNPQVFSVISWCVIIVQSEITLSTAVHLFFYFTLTSCYHQIVLHLLPHIQKTVTHFSLPLFFLSLPLNVSFKLPVKYRTLHVVVWIMRRQGTSWFEVLIILGQNSSPVFFCFFVCSAWAFASSLLDYCSQLFIRILSGF